MVSSIRTVLAVAVLAATIAFGAPFVGAANQTVPGSQAGAAGLNDVINHPSYTETDAATLRLYRAFFDRDPDLTGAVYWLGANRTTTCLDDVIWSFANSTEFINTYGGETDDSQFLTIVYSNVLGRTPDTAGFNYWLDELQKGLSREGVVRWVAANDELIARHPYKPAVWTGNTATYIDCRPIKPPSTTPTPTPVPPVEPVKAVYANCSEVRAAGAAPLYRGQPGYSTDLDRDGDGVACER